MSLQMESDIQKIIIVFHEPFRFSSSHYVSAVLSTWFFYFYFLIQQFNNVPSIVCVFFYYSIFIGMNTMKEIKKK